MVDYMKVMVKMQAYMRTECETSVTTYFFKKSTSLKNVEENMRVACEPCSLLPS